MLLISHKQFSYQILIVEYYNLLEIMGTTLFFIKNIYNLMKRKLGEITYTAQKKG